MAIGLVIVSQTALLSNRESAALLDRRHDVRKYEAADMTAATVSSEIRLKGTILYAI